MAEDVTCDHDRVVKGGGVLAYDNCSFWGEARTPNIDNGEGGLLSPPPPSALLPLFRTLVKFTVYECLTFGGLDNGYFEAVLFWKMVECNLLNW